MVIENEKKEKSNQEKQEPENKETKVDLGLLEEDDEFEEFPAEDWKEKNEELNVWEDNWDDDNIEDDFSKQLKDELEKQNLKFNSFEPMKM